MKFAWLILTATTLGVALVACVSPAPLPPPPLLPGSGLLAESLLSTTCPVTQFLAKVHFLDVSGASFHLPESGFSKTPPIDNTPVAGNIRQDLIDAFNIAPNFFKTQLCNLDGIYIDPTGCNDPHTPSTCGPIDQLADNFWGFRAYSNGNVVGRYTGTSLALWKNGSAPAYNDYRTQRLALLLKRISSGNSANWPTPPSYSNAWPNNTSEMSVLAALAHEAGHVLWYDTFVLKVGDVFTPSNSCGGFYVPNSWSDIEVPPGRWIKFGQQNNDILHNPDYLSILTNDFKIGLGKPSPNFLQIGEDLHNILKDQGLTSVLSSISPDEDFVETYELYVMLFASKNGVRQLQSLQLNNIVGLSQPYPHDDATDFKGKYDLIKKMTCFGSLP